MATDLHIPAEPTDTEDLRPGVRLCAGRFTLEHRLGRGGVATVYQAIDTHTHSRVALKVISAVRGDAQEQTRFENELVIGDRLGSHPNLVRPLACGRVAELDGRLFLASELVAGPTLADLVIVRPLPVDRACRLVRDVACGLLHMHRRGVVHRDVKPANVMIEPLPNGSERARLLDFGYAFALEHALLPSAARLTAVDERPGTKHYMAPEQVLGQPPAPSFDVYALAVTLFEALVGQPPFHADSPVEIARRKVDADEPEFSISGRRPDLPNRLVDLIDHGLRRRAADRPRDMQAFIEELDDVLRDPASTDDRRPRAELHVVPTGPSVVAAGAREVGDVTRADLMRKGIALPFVKRARGEQRLEADGFEDEDDPYGYRKYDEPEPREAHTDPDEGVAAIPARGGTEPAPAAEPWSHGEESVRRPIGAAWKIAALGVLSIAVAALVYGAVTRDRAPADDTASSVEPSRAAASAPEHEVAPPHATEAKAPTPVEPVPEPAAAEPEPTPAEAASAAPDSNPERASPRAVDEPERRTKRTASEPASEPRAPQVDCAEVTRDVDRARTSRSWNRLAALTVRSNASCWSSRKAWMRDRVLALYKSGDYERCRKVAEGSSDSEVTLYAKLCAEREDR